MEQGRVDRVGLAGGRVSHDRYHAIEYVFEPLGVVLNAADEVAVAAFLDGMIPFAAISRVVAATLDHLPVTDVHTVASLDDDYDRDFMAAADILFLSDEYLPCQPEHFARQIMDRYRPRLLVIGLGAEGALLAVRDDNFVSRFPAVQTRPVVNTIGAGDALFSAFLHAYMQSRNPISAIKKAIIFASYKIGGTSAAEGFLSDSELDKLFGEVADQLNY